MSASATPTPTPLLDLSAVDPCDLTANHTLCFAARKATDFAAWNPWWVLLLCTLFLLFSLFEALTLFFLPEHRMRRLEAWLYRRVTRHVLVWAIGNDGEGDVGRTWSERLGFRGWRAFVGRRREGGGEGAVVDELGGIELRVMRRRRGTSLKGNSDGTWHRLED
ncbi:hypothetical protein BDV96DRAFT_644654 [Lophiotrema nucula]|uniref:Uncharacterized protein n=1 Tax=Lophiotrema nucula TaxID=690887 RepID=A0A6A5ZDS4_9PLEO|nr:hypothetical protein BDV96DRAFT_644654 [Lophiotrema nucula]